MREMLSVIHKGSNIVASNEWFGATTLMVDGKMVGSVTKLFHLDRKDVLVEGDVELVRGPAQLALYAEALFVSVNLVIMDGDTVIAASRPDKLPASRQPKPEP